MYSQEITRQHRTAFILALDRSGSMQESVRFGKKVMSKAEAVSIIANALITELIDRCRRTDSLRNYYDVAVVGYSNDNIEMLLGRDGMLSIDDLSRISPRRRTLSDEEQLSEQNSAIFQHSLDEWFTPHAEGNTPMYEAMLRVRDLAKEWCEKSENRQSFPPVVINITDGEASDCDDNELRDICEQIKRIATDDGNVLLINIHISTDSTLPAIIFPMAEELTGAGRYSRLLAECSSVMPSAFDSAICEMKGRGATPPFFGMGYNASIIELLSMVNIGSRSVTNMQ
jgi:hypothetical protein